MTAAIATILALSILAQDPSAAPAAPATEDPFVEPPPPPVCTDRQVTCATGCYPLGSSCPSAGELDPKAIHAAPPKAKPRESYDERDEFTSTRRSSARRAEGCDEPLGEWYARRLRVGVGLGIPGAAMLAIPIYSAAAGAFDSDLASARSKGVAATFGIIGGILVITALIAPRMMARRTVRCSSSTCSLAFRF